MSLHSYAPIAKLDRRFVQADFGFFASITAAATVRIQTNL
jgi:hypothetical protein